MEKFTIKNRYGLKIVGELHIPEKQTGLAFVEHGLGGFKEQPHIMALVETLVKNNYWVVNFDGTHSFGESDGRYEDATAQFHYEDLVDVIEWSKSQSWYMEPFVLAGHSLGGYAVARYAEEYSNKVKGIFPYALMVSGELNQKANEKFEPEEYKKWQETGWDERENKSKPGVIKRLPWSHMEERLTHDVLPKVSFLTMPVLLLAGEYDQPCPPEMQEVLYKALPKETDKEFHIIKGAPHTFKEPEHIRELQNIFNNWLKKV